MRNLLLTGGIGHPFDDAAPALAEILQEEGVTSEIMTDLDEGFSRLDTEQFELVTVYALRWRMLSGEKYAPHRKEWAFETPLSARNALTRHLAGGGALLGLHTAIICFDDWPEWKEVLGGAWVWGRSFHLPRGHVEARPTSRSHPITAGLPPFELGNDEIYSGLDLAPDVTPLLEGRSHEPSPDDHPDAVWPLLWARQFGGGRVVYDALGHDRASLHHPVHRTIITRSARWLLG